MKRQRVAYIVKRNRDVNLGVTSNIKAAYRLIKDLCFQGTEVPKTYNQIVKALKESGYVNISEMGNDNIIYGNVIEIERFPLLTK